MAVAREPVGEEIARADSPSVPRPRGERLVWVVGSTANDATAALVVAWQKQGLPAALVSGAEAIAAARPGDVVIGRVDVRPTLDGVEPGLLALLLLERRGIDVINRAEALLATHDKLRSARALVRSGIPHPVTVHIRPGEATPFSAAPCVLKPRFGSWGAEVTRCQTDAEIGACFDHIRRCGWFRRHGVLVQELLPPSDRDLRVLVAGGRVVGAATRIAAPGEWRTNVTLGGSLEPAAPDDDAFELARTAAAVVGADFVGVDLTPSDGGHVVLELNGAVDFDETYSFDGRNVFADVARVLGVTSPVSASTDGPSTASGDDRNRPGRR